MTLDELNRELIECQRCPRLVEWREKVAREKRRAYRDWDYWGKPVPGFGDLHAHVMMVGLAPGAHGSNRTGRMFTGDASGDFLYPALYQTGFTNQPDSHARDDGLTLKDMYITAVCRCVPPGNKPTPQEMENCQSYLLREIEMMQPTVFVALGRIAFNNLLRILFFRENSLTFTHCAVYPLVGSKYLVCSYHPSRQNTQTGRLTSEMFDQVWKIVKDLLER